MSRLIGIPEANVGAVLRLFIPDLTGIATPLESGAPGFLRGGLASGGVAEYVIPNDVNSEVSVRA